MSSPTRKWVANFVGYYIDYLGPRHIGLSPIVVGCAALYGDDYGLAGASIAIGFVAGTFLRNSGTALARVYAEVLGLAGVALARGPVSFLVSGNPEPMHTNLFIISAMTVGAVVAFNTLRLIPQLRPTLDGVVENLLAWIDPDRAKNAQAAHREVVKTSLPQALRNATSTAGEGVRLAYELTDARKAERNPTDGKSGPGAGTDTKVSCQLNPFSSPTLSHFNLAMLRHLGGSGDRQEPPPRPAGA